MSIDFPNHDPREWELRLLVERLKYERYLQSETEAIIEAAFNRVLDVLLSSTYRGLSAFQRQKALQLFRQLEKLIHAGYGDIARLHVSEMQGFAQMEAELARGSLAEIAGKELRIAFGPFLPKHYVTSIAKLPIQGLDIGQWFDAQARTMSLETRRIIQQGLIEGKGGAQIASRILASDKVQGAVLSRRARSEARSISRTILNAVQNDAQFASLSSLPTSVSDRYIWESVIDSRTSPICRALSGRTWRYNDPARRIPPAHISCRSTVRALLRGIDYSLKDQSEPRTIKSYADWLRQQPASKQDDILGPTRGRWFRDGTMSLADAIDADNRVLTLKQLRAKLASILLAGAGT